MYTVVCPVSIVLSSVVCYLNYCDERCRIFMRVVDIFAIMCVVSTALACIFQYNVQLSVHTLGSGVLLYVLIIK